MLRVVHLFDLKKGVSEREFLEWLDAELDVVTRRLGCVTRRTWIYLDGFSGTYARPSRIKSRPRFVNEAYWTDEGSANRFRDWLRNTPEGQELHDRWFGSIRNHTVLRYVEGWTPIPMEG